jgi:CheY-like chemotaxis protein
MTLKRQLFNRVSRGDRFMTVVTKLRATGCGYRRLRVPSCARLKQKEAIYDSRHIRLPSVHTRGVEPSLDRACRATGKYVNSKGYIRIFEQDPLIRPLLERWLGEAGYEVTTPAAGRAKLALVIADVPDPQAAERLIHSLQEYAVPILLLSGRFRPGLASSVEAARRLGVNKVLPKPFTRRELLAAVHEVLEGAP